jgi:GNAT superfamily N-acetyltransferase
MTAAPEHARIRTALPADDPALIDLIQTLNAYEAVILGDRRTDREAAEAYHRDLCERMAQQEGRLLVAEAEGRIVALLGLVVQEDPVFLAEDLRRHCYVTDLVVDEEWRGRGVSKALLAEAERVTREKGLKRMMISVVAGNDVAERAYEAAGFQLYGKILIKPLD